MKFEVPKVFPPLTEDEKLLIHESIEIYDGFVYFHRVPNPTDASVVYSTTHIVRLLVEKKYTSLIVDFTDRSLVDHRLRRAMLSRASEMASFVTDVGIVLDGNSFRRIIIDFFVRAYIRRHTCNIRFFATKSEAISGMSTGT